MTLTRMRRLVITLLLILAPSAWAADFSNPYARDLLILTDWFEGEFDNEEQLWFERISRTAEADRHGRLHVMHRRLDLPQFGEHVFYVEEYSDNDPTKLIRQRFVTFEADVEAKAIRMKQGFFKDAKSFTGGFLDPSKFADLSSDDLFFMSDLDPNSQCDIFWKRVGEQFEGRIPVKGCVFGEGDKRRYSVHTMILSQNKYWRADASYLVSNDQLHVGHGEDSPIEMRRAQTFYCTLSVRQDDGSLKEVGNKRIFSQGGGADFKHPNGKEYSVLMREKEYPYYDTRPDFIYFSVREKGAKRSLVYTVADPDSRQLGASVDGMGFFCYREGYDFRQTLDQLP